jgi:NAD(P)-dependent dehydrogenase (short-subunit alcohol dehydrogenase family)
MQNIVITGAEGFIGKIIVSALTTGFNRLKYNLISYDTRIHEVKDLLKWDGIDAFIHCARHHANIVPPITEEKWLAEYKTDVVDPYELVMGLKRYFNTPNIICISSIYGIEPPKVRWIPHNYVCAKAAEIMCFKNLAVQLAPDTRVNTIILGGVHSDRDVAEQDDNFRAAYHKRTLLGHMVHPEEIIGPIKLLLSNESKGMTGAQIRVDGGYLV